MAEHIFSVLCRDVIFEEGNQVMTLLRVVERVNVVNVEKMEAETPTFIPHPMKIVSNWVRKKRGAAESTFVKYSIVFPDGGREEGGVVMEIDLLENDTVRTIGNIKGFPNRGFGTYWFEVNQSRDRESWRRVARFPMQFGTLEEWQAEKSARED